MVRSRLAAAVLCRLLLSAAFEAALEEQSALTADDECTSAGIDSSGECALSVLQVRGRMLAQQAAFESTALLADAEPNCTEPYTDCRGQTTCCDEMMTCFEKNRHWAQCQNACKPGDWTCKILGGRLQNRSHHLTHGGGQLFGDRYAPALAPLLAPSRAEVFTFYMYRALANKDYEMENVNTANLPGVLWYLNNEVVITTPRKFGITRLVRYKVQTKAPQPLLDAGMHFGVRYAFDHGQCTGPYDCEEQFQRYGYFVGCNNLGEFPYPTFKVYYPGATWYSLPGPCPNRVLPDKKGMCVKQEPGGACVGTPTGQGHCTFSYTMAGEIRLDDLEALGGNATAFWDGLEDAEKCEGRLSMARKLFAEKYPDDPKDEDMPSPKCDFARDRFFGRDMEA